jgi:hypothetical protein
LEGPDAWDAIRERRPDFAIPPTLEELAIAARGRPELAARAETIRIVLDDFGTRLASYGVGTGLLEAALRSADPDTSLTLTEFAPMTIVKLRRLFPESTVCEHDLRRDGPLPADLHLFHRIDSEFSDVEWREILQRWSVPILFVLTEFLTIRGVGREAATRLFHRGATRAGYTRTRSAFSCLWAPTHRAEPLKVADLHGFLLLPR